MLEDARLIWKFNRGERDVLHEMYEKYKYELVTLAAAVLCDRSAAEDVVQDVFVGLAKRARKLKVTQNLKGYLLTAVANRARTANKASARYRTA